MDKDNSSIYILVFNGEKYAIREHDVKHVKTSEKVYLLPSPDEDREVYITSVNDEMVYLYDINRYFGDKSDETHNECSIFIVSKEDKIQGFFHNTSDSRLVNPEIIIKLPEFLKSKIIDSCAIVDGYPVPLLNIAEIHKSAQESELKAPSLKYNFDKTARTEISDIKNFKIYKTGDQFFCLPDTNLNEFKPDPEMISDISILQDPVRGIAYNNGNIITVIGLSGLLGVSADKDNILITSDIGTQSFGFSADSYIKSISSNEVKIMELPLILQTGWIKFALVENNGIYPVIDLFALLSEIKNRKDKGSFMDRIKTDSDFSERFGNMEVSVLEFEIGTSLFGIPESEVIDSFTRIPIHVIPLMPILVPGIACYNDELLPVIDLGRWVGEKTGADTGSDMILVKNGNFKVILMADRAIGLKNIAKDKQKYFPLAHHKFIYGCYIDDKVRLILNIEAITLNSEMSSYKSITASAESSMEDMPESGIHTAIAVEESLEEIIVKPPVDVEAGEKKQEVITGEIEEEVLQEEEIKPDLKKESRKPLSRDAEDKNTITIENSEEHMHESAIGAMGAEGENKTEDIEKPLSEEENRGIKQESVTDKIEKEDDDKSDVIISIKEAGRGKEQDIIKDTEITNLPIDEVTAEVADAETETAASHEQITDIGPLERDDDKKKIIPHGAAGRYVKLLLLPVVFAALLYFLYWLFFILPGGFMPKKFEPGKGTVTDRRETAEADKGIEISKEEHKLIIIINEKKIIFKSIQFLSNSAKFLPGEKKKLDIISITVNKYRGKNIIISGHTALWGTERGREILSELRAATVGKYLISTGSAKKEQIKYRSMGAKSPVADNSSAEEMKKNRRTEISILKKQP